MNQRIYFIRHGKTLANETGIYCGWLNPPILESEKIRLSQTKEPELSMIYLSPLLRCIQTKEAMYPLADYEVIDGLKEIHFGEFEGKDYQALSKDIRYQAWIDSLGRLPFPEGESMESFIARVKVGLQEIKSKIKQYSGDIGIIAHEGTYRAFFQLVGQGDYFEAHIANGEILDVTEYFDKLEEVCR